MKEKILLIWKHLKQGTLKKMWKQTLWSYQYGRRYWKAMILYTLLGFQSDFQRSGGYYYRTPDRETCKYLCRNDRLLCRKHSGFAGIRICLYFH